MSVFRYSASLLIAFTLICTTPIASWADDDDQPTQRDNSVNILLRKELAVLRLTSKTISDPCVKALKKLHTTQNLLKEHEGDDQNPDIAVVEDVLESDFETASERCAVDVRDICQNHKSSKDILKACGKIDNLPNENE
ncbi:MAG: hypothetical protein J6P00_06425 [Acetobacter sp.]|nr:hypothetical protein [Acetobacter sp.]MBO6091830.1 hypothetical protein [Acetobacter sp.]MBO7072410.1 hypothetical protein [Acetobacter sp.]MBO7351254.1 hypothetical protein [Acetobacter sp.]MBQ5469336.1 hypothetical protein [Acetobacter sp.]